MKSLFKNIFNKEAKQGVLLIGFGTHMRTVLLASLRHLEIPIFGVYARNPDKIKDQASILGISKNFQSWEEVENESGKISAAIICTHSDSHPELIRKMMPLNIPVFVEKPVASNTDALRDLINDIGIMGAPIMVGMQKRFVPHYRKAKELIQQKQLGDFVHLNFRFVTGPLGLDNDFLLEIGIHAIDLVYFLLGRSHPAGVTYKTINGRRHYGLLYHNENGDSAFVETSEMGDWNEVNECLEITGEGHRITIENLTEFKWQKPDGQENIFEVPNYTVPIMKNDSLYLQGYIPELQHFFESLENKKSPGPELNDCLLPLELVSLIKSETGNN